MKKKKTIDISEEKGATVNHKLGAAENNIMQNSPV